MNSADHEEKLQELVSVHLPQNRNRWALNWKEKGKKVVGILDTLVPEEILYAAGILPYRIIGTQNTSTPLAEIWRPPDMCRYCNHVLESLLTGELDFLDGMLFTDWDDDERRLYDVPRHFKKPKFNYLLHVPHGDSKICIDIYERDLKRIVEWLHDSFNVSLDDERLWEAIRLYNKMRRLLMKLYEWRKREVPPISGTEAAGIVMAAYFMPKEEFISRLESLMPYLEKRKAPLKKLIPRLLVVSDHLDNLEYTKLIETHGIIAMDDLDNGSRYFWDLVETDTNPLHSLSRRYIIRPSEPCKWFWHKQVDRVIDWIKEYQVHGVLELPHIGDEDRLCCTPYFLNRLKKEGIPAMSFTREYHFGNVGQLTTRIEAFVETLKLK
jgi:benzoyl-CoA reductase subunit C